MHNISDMPIEALRALEDDLHRALPREYNENSPEFVAWHVVYSELVRRMYVQPK